MIEERLHARVVAVHVVVDEAGHRRRETDGVDGVGGERERVRAKTIWRSDCGSLTSSRTIPTMFPSFDQCLNRNPGDFTSSRKCS
jgi:hypothetical protein